MAKKTIKTMTVLAWGQGQSTIDVTEKYYNVCQLIGVKSFENLSEVVAQTVLKQLLREYKEQNISVLELGALSALLYEEAKIFNSKNDEWQEIVMRLDELMYNAIHFPKAIDYDIQNAVDFVSKLNV